MGSSPPPTKQTTGARESAYTNGRLPGSTLDSCEERGGTRGPILGEENLVLFKVPMRTEFLVESYIRVSQIMELKGECFISLNSSRFGPFRS